MVRFALFFFMLFVSSCAVSGKDLTQKDVEAFEVGRTTLDDVKLALGEPTSRSTDSFGYQHLYYTKSFSYIKGESFLPYIGNHAGGYIDKTQTYSFSFDHDFILSDMSFIAKKANVFNSALPAAYKTQ